jgi:ectoine hydroxylase
MRWTQQQLRQFDEQGFLFSHGLISPQEIAEMNAAIPALLAGDESQDGIHRERERSGAVRQIYLTHRHSPPFKELSGNPKIVDPVKQVIGNDIYIWHSKINVKDAFEGTVWLWHQDYGYWMWDGIDPKVLSVMVFLDEATLNNGCLMVAAGSHKWGRLEHYADEVTTSYKQWCVDTPTLKVRLKENMIQPITGQPGDALFFHCNLLHGSGHNMSPLPRKTIIVAYNTLDNKPRPVEKPRPDWVVSREFEPV